jgi:hypothetical protein
MPMIEPLIQLRDHQRQLDPDGTFVGVSRQALDEVLNGIRIGLKGKFEIGDLVRKPRGYAFDGTIVSIFQMLNGETRVVAELTTANGAGMLHIFNEGQLELRTDAS